MKKMNEIYESAHQALAEAKKKDVGKGFLRIDRNTLILVDSAHLKTEATRKEKEESYRKMLKHFQKNY